MTTSSLPVLAFLLGIGVSACSSSEAATKAGDGGGGDGAAGKAGAAGKGGSGGGGGGGGGGAAGKAGTGGNGTAGKDAGSGDGAAYPKGCDYPDASTYNPTINPADFTTTVDNKYLPLVPGTTYRTADADGNTNDFEITHETKVILGVTCLVIHDVA